MKENSHKNYLLIILLVILTFNYVDRIALGLVAENLKTDLGLSDTQLGFLSGIAFALFYSVMGIPIARWADRGDRVTIISVTTALWSAAVALCGMAGSFLQLMLIRVVVGVGEAGCVPPAHSLIADYFERGDRPRAVSLYMQGISLSLVIGYFAAGWLNQFYGWRAMFVMIGLPGLALAAWSWFGLPEPRRARARTGTAAEPLSHPDFKEVCATLWASPTFRHLLISYSVTAFFCYGTLQWTPVFFVRSFGMKTGELGTWLAVIYGLGSLLGTYWGGEWAFRHAAHDERLQLKAMTIVSYASGIFAAFTYLTLFSPNYYWAFAWLGLYTVANTMVNGPLLAVIQTLVPERMRAMSIAFIYLFANLIGMGLGPWAAGALSDALRPWGGEESLRYAMLVLCPGFLWGAWHLWAGSKTVTREVEAASIVAGREATFPTT
jgi:MFS family permease